MENSTKRLSLAELKVKANALEKGDVLEKIAGGGFSDCHGWWGQVGKTVKQLVTDDWNDGPGAQSKP